MLAGPEDREDNLRRGIVGVGHAIEGQRDPEFFEQEQEFIQQGALVAVGEAEALMDAAGQRQSKVALRGLNHHGDGLAGVAEDELRFGIVLRFLVQLLDRRHLAPGLGGLDAVGEQNEASVHREEVALEDPENQARPKSRELGHNDRRAVEEIQQPVIKLPTEAQRPHKARDSAQIAPHGKSGQHDREPKEGAIAAESGAQTEDQIPPGEPEKHENSLRLRFIGVDSEHYDATLCG